MSMNPFCEIALEEALRIKESGAASELGAVSVGPAHCVDTPRRPRGAPPQVYPLSVAKVLRSPVEVENPGLLILGKQVYRIKLQFLKETCCK